MQRSVGLGLLLLAVLAPALAAKPPQTDLSLCQQLDKWAASIPAGQSSTVRLSRRGVWMVNHIKECKFTETDPASQAFCSWLMENSSTEFMESNINRALSCLQGQRILGYDGNTGIESWSGKATFYSPHLETEGAEVDIEYFMDNSTPDREDFLKITVRRD